MIQIKNRINSRLFFSLYFGTITMILIIWLLLPGSDSIYSIPTGALSDKEYELKDSAIYRLKFTVKQDSPEGFSIFSYNSNNVIFTDEKLVLSYYSDWTSQPFQIKTFLFRDLQPNPLIFTRFDDQNIKTGQTVFLQIQTEGLEDGRSDYPVIEASEITDDSVLWKNGDPQTYGLYAGCSYRNHTKDYIKPVIYFLAECLIGGILLLIQHLWKLQVNVPGKEEKELYLDRIPARRMASVVGIFLIVGIVFFEYVFSMVQESSLSKRTFEVMHPKIASLQRYDRAAQEEINTVLEEEAVPIELSSRDIVSQAFLCPEDKLSGIGISFETGDVPFAFRLFDENGSLLYEINGNVKELLKLRKYISEKEAIGIRKISKHYYVIDLQDVIQDSAGKKYYYELENTGSQTSSLLRINTMKLTSGEYTSALNGSKEDCIISCAAVFTSHENTGFAYLLFMVLLLIAGSIYLCMTNGTGMSVRTSFLAGIIILGLAMSLLIPPYCVPDEWTHIDSAYRISNTLLGIRDGDLPSEILKRKCDIDIENMETAYITPKRYDQVVQAFRHPVVSAYERALVSKYAGTAVQNVTLLNYLPSAIGISLARILGLNNILMILLARWINLIVVSMLCFYGIGRIPFGKAAIAVIAMLPISLQQFASCSYDGVIIGLSFVFLGECFAFTCGRCHGGLKNYLVLLLSGMLIAANKGGVYIPLLGLVLLPVVFWKGKWGKKAGLVLLHGAVFLMIGLVQFSILFAKYLIAPVESTASPASRVASYFSVSYALTHPGATFRIFENTFFRLSDQYLLQMLGGLLGRLQVPVSWFFIMCFLLLICLGAQKVRPEERELSGREKGYLAVLCAGCYLLILCAMLFGWTSTDKDIIEGVQGRYFLPVAGLAAVLLRSRTFVSSTGNVRRIMSAVFCIDLLIFGYILLYVLA